MIEPTDKSMPPVRITIVWPIAMMAVRENARATLNRFADFRNASELNASTVDSRTTAIATLNSRQLVIRLIIVSNHIPVGELVSLASLIKTPPLLIPSARPLS